MMLCWMMTICEPVSKMAGDLNPLSTRMSSSSSGRQKSGWQASGGDGRRGKLCMVVQCRGSRRSVVDHLILVGLYAAYLELLCNIFANGVAGCKGVSGCGERKLALHKVVFKF